MKTITDNPEEFFETGGWNFLDPDSGSEEEEETEDEEDEEFKVSDDDSTEEVILMSIDDRLVEFYFSNNL